MGGPQQTWDLWIPDTAATGVPFARGRVNPTDVLLVHSAPHLLTVEVRDDSGEVVARGQDLRREEQVPMTRLRIQGTDVQREEVWPTAVDYGAPVLLPGGEVGLLREWWNREDRREWTWSVEFHNSLD
ncbi:MAG TPA: hypothetical protein VF137_01470 [Candidatus Dormibacteraeota bacterium]